MHTVIFNGYTVKDTGEILSKRGRPLKFSKTRKGYLITSFRINGKSVTKHVHRVIAKCFIENPDNLSDVDHIDGCRDNNHVSNLRWLSHGDNIRHSYSINNRSASGVNNARAILTEKDVHNICKLMEDGCSDKYIVSVGYKLTTIKGIRQRKNWTYISSLYNIPDSRVYTRLSKDDVIDICKCFENGSSLNDLVRSGYNYGSLQAIKYRRQWKNISKYYKW